MINELMPKKDENIMIQIYLEEKFKEQIEKKFGNLGVKEGQINLLSEIITEGEVLYGYKVLTPATEMFKETNTIVSLITIENFFFNVMMTNNFDAPVVEFVIIGCNENYEDVTKKIDEGYKKSKEANLNVFEIGECNGEVN